MNDIEFDSDGEEQFYYYLEELKASGYIDNFNYQPDAFKLTDKIEYVWINTIKNKEVITSATLLNSHEYTCDFVINWNKKAKGIFFLNITDKLKLNKIPFISQNNTSYIECKPSWDQHNMTRLAKINIKQVYVKFGIYVQIITPTSNKGNCLFSITFTPIKAQVTKVKNKPKKFKFIVRSLEEFINENI